MFFKLQIRKNINRATTNEGLRNYCRCLLVVGDCLAAEPSARTPTTAVGLMGNTNEGKNSHRKELGKDEGFVFFESGCKPGIERYR